MSAKMISSLSLAVLLVSAHAQKLRVAVAGDSIVAGSKVKGSENYWPAVMGRNLDWATAGNYGFSGRTIGPESAWYRSEQHCAMLHDGFDVAIVALGTNDAKTRLADVRDQLVNRYKVIVLDLVRLEPRLQAIFLCAPVPILRSGGDFDAGLLHRNQPSYGSGREIEGGYLCGLGRVDAAAPYADRPSWGA